MSKNVLSYKGYLGAVRFDARDQVLRGRVVNIDDIVTFQAPDAASIAAEFRDSVDDYLEQCAELGQDPDPPASGTLTLRIKPRTHRILQASARARDRSLNREIATILDRAARRIQAAAVVSPSPAKKPGGPAAVGKNPVRVVDPASTAGVPRPAKAGSAAKGKAEAGVRKKAEAD